MVINLRAVVIVPGFGEAEVSFIVASAEPQDEEHKKRHKDKK